MRLSRQERNTVDRMGIAYELAYEARVASDALRFAIKHLESERSEEEHQQTAIVLLDAFDRLVRAERHFRSLRGVQPKSGDLKSELTALENRI